MMIKSCTNIQNVSLNIQSRTFVTYFALGKTPQFFCIFMKFVNLNWIVTIVECVNEDCREVRSEVEISVKSFIKLTGPLLLRNPILRSNPRLK